MKNKTYREEEMKEFSDAIKLNIIRSAKSLVDATIMMSIEIKTEENKKFAEEIKNLSDDSFKLVIRNYDTKFAEKLTKLWEDTGIQTVLEHRSKYQLLDSTE
jgi:excinuclease UvrABC helicase subunit UvrB